MTKLTIQELLDSLPSPVVQHIQHLERMRQDFVANVSHELRTPLTVIHGYLEILLDQKASDLKPWQTIFSQMHEQTLRMENLVENLLLLSRLENDEHEDATETVVSVAVLLEALVQEAISLSGALQHKIHCVADKNIQLMGCEEELRSLFSNLIINAVKYTPAGGSINIRWYSHSEEVCFEVQDTGIGIAAKHIPRLTERFYRADPGRSRASGGTGLGLAIAKHVLIRHQATLDIQSELGKGSVFRCFFPKERLLIHE